MRHERDLRPMRERFLELLPLDGTPVYYGALMRDAHRLLYLNAGQAGAILTLLCSQRLAISEVRGDHQFVRRLPAHAEVIPLPRPRAPVRAGTLILRAAGWR